MSTPFPVHLALAAALVAGGCSNEVGPDPRVSYAGLDAPLDAEMHPPITLGIVADTTGPGRAVGRAFAEVLRARLEAEPPLRDRRVRVAIFDDRGTPEGVRGAAARLEHDPAVLLAIVQPGSARLATTAQIASRTPLVCAGCGDEESSREGAFNLDARGDRDPVAATAEWVLAAMRATPSWLSGPLASTLRATPAPSGAMVREGELPGSEPNLFRVPPAAGSRP